MAPVQFRSWEFTGSTDSEYAGSSPARPAMKNKDKVKFESGRRVGRNEVFLAVREVARRGFDSFRNCHSGCFESAFVEALKEYLEKEAA